MAETDRELELQRFPGVQPLNPVSTLTVKLNQGESKQLNVQHFQWEFFEQTLQDGASNKLIFAYGQDPALVAPVLAANGYPVGVGVARLHDVFWAPRDAKNASAGYIWIQRPGDGVAGTNTYTLRFALRNDVNLFVNSSTPTTQSCCQGTQLLASQSTTTKTAQTYTIDTNVFPGMKSIAALLNSTNVDPVAVTLTCYADAAQTIVVYSKSYNSPWTDKYVLFGDEYAGVEAGVGDVLDVLPTPLPRIIKVAIGAAGASPGVAFAMWGR